MDRISSIQLAIENETSEMEFYQSQARRSKNTIAKALFETLAGEERDHMTRIKGLHGKLIRDGVWPDNVPIEVAGTNVKSVLTDLNRNPAADAQHNDDDIAALKKSRNFEQRGSLFYAELAGKCGNPQEAKFFRFLSEIEREHMLSVDDSLSYLEDPQGWLQSKGRSGLDGA